MPRKTAETVLTRNWNKPYSIEESNLIFVVRARAHHESTIRDIDENVLGRKTPHCDKHFGRICRNAKDYAITDKLIYDIQPPSNKKYPGLNRYAEKYIRYQIFRNEIKSTPELVARQLAAPLEKVLEFIEKVREQEENRIQNQYPFLEDDED